MPENKLLSPTSDTNFQPAFEPIQEGRIYIEKLNGPFLFGDKATPAEYTAGLKRAISSGWLEIHDSGTFVKLTQAGADLFA